MRRDEALRLLAADRDRLRAMSVRALLIFGSVARDEATDASDIDLLVEFEPEAHVGYFGCLSELKFHLEEMLGCRVDLATRGALRQEMRDQIMKEAVRAA